MWSHKRQPAKFESSGDDVPCLKKKPDIEKLSLPERKKIEGKRE
jgi:hypothetical protein